MHISEELEHMFLERRYEDAVNLIKSVDPEGISSHGMTIITSLITVGLRIAHSPEEIQYAFRALRHVVAKMNPKEALTTLLENWLASEKQYQLLQFIEIALQSLSAKSWHLHMESVLSAILRKLRSSKLPDELLQKTRIYDSKKLSSLENSILNETVLIPVGSYANFARSCWNMLESRRAELDQNTLGVCTGLLKNFILQLLAFPLAWCQFDAPSCSDATTLRTNMQERRFDHVELVDTQAGILAKSIKQTACEVGVTIQNVLELELVDAEPGLGDITESHSALPSVTSYLYSCLENRNNSCGFISLPSPMSPKFAFIQSAVLVSELAENNSVELQVKSLTVCYALLQNLCNRTDYLLLDIDYLQSPVHSDFFPKLCNILTFSEDPGVRKVGSALFVSYIWSFNASGRLAVMTEILNSPFQDTVIGYSITQLKDFVNQAISQKTGSRTCLRLRQEEAILPEMSTCFLGSNLKKLSIACIRRSTKGDKLDVMEQHSTIVSTLNFLRFLSIRDGNRNVSGVLDWEDEVKPFFEYIRSAVEITKLRTNADINAVKNEAVVGHTPGAPDLQIVDQHGAAFGNEEEMTKDEKIKSYNIMLCNLDIVEGLLVRTSQCYEASLKYKPC